MCFVATSYKITWTLNKAGTWPIAPELIIARLKGKFNVCKPVIYEVVTIKTRKENYLVEDSGFSFVPEWTPSAKQDVCDDANAPYIRFRARFSL